MYKSVMQKGRRAQLKLDEKFGHYKKHLPLIAFIWGFIWDNLTLSRVDLLFDNIVLFSYLSISLGCIVLINLRGSGKLQGNRFNKFAEWLPFIMQFAFGGLFSGYLVYYSRSGSLASGWLFVLVLAFLFIGNEFFKKRYQLLTFQLSIFFTALYTFTIFYIPIIVGAISALVFILSGLISILMILLIFFALSRIIPAGVQLSKRSLALSISGIYIGFHILYFTNIIPPLPLSLKDIGIFHHVERTTSGDYMGLYERAEWYKFFSRQSNTYNRTAGESAYCFSAVFTPTRLSTKILHRWQYYNEIKGKWETNATVGYQIGGGRDGGFRGYTIKQNIFPGRWRCDVITERGALIGRVKFTVIQSISSPTLESGVL